MWWFQCTMIIRSVESMILSVKSHHVQEPSVHQALSGACSDVLHKRVLLQVGHICCVFSADFTNLGKFVGQIHTRDTASRVCAKLATHL